MPPAQQARIDRARSATLCTMRPIWLMSSYCKHWIGNRDVPGSRINKGQVGGIHVEACRLDTICPQPPNPTIRNNRPRRYVAPAVACHSHLNCVATAFVAQESVSALKPVLLFGGRGVGFEIIIIFVLSSAPAQRSPPVSAEVTSLAASTVRHLSDM